MENFFNWIVKPIPKDEVTIWFNIHNMSYEKIELYGDIFMTLHYLIVDTYMDNDSIETKIIITNKDNENHFNWCWNKMIEMFESENIQIIKSGKHKDYFKSFYMDTFYNVQNKVHKDSIHTFLTNTFNVNQTFTKSDLDILTEIYKLLDNNIEYSSL